MDFPKLTFFDEWNEDGTEIPWQRKGRERLNAVIRSFNNWQRAVGIGYGDVAAIGARATRVLIEEARQTWARRDGGEAWLEKIEEMAAILERSES